MAAARQRQIDRLVAVAKRLIVRDIEIWRSDQAADRADKVDPLAVDHDAEIELKPIDAGEIPKFLGFDLSLRRAAGDAENPRRPR